MTFYVTADIRGKQVTETAETVLVASHWIDEFEEMGGIEIHVRDEHRTFTLDQIRELANA